MDNNNSIVINEGQEADEFWTFLGGKEPYMDEFVLKSIGEPTMPRLFYGSNASGSFKMEEVLNFTQVDLVTDDVMLLDTGETLFVWLGYESSKSERTEVL